MDERHSAEIVARAEQRARACTCLQLRKLTRRVTRHYDRSLRPAGLNATQLPVLTVVQYRGRITVGALAAELDLERTSLGRILRPLVAKGWLTIEPGTDKRQRLVSLTATGAAALAAAEPRWRQAQLAVQRVLGADDASALRDTIAHTLEVLRQDDF